MGFEKIFDKVYSSSDIGCRKPSAEFFSFVLKDIGVSAENVVYFDNEEEMITSAKQLGICGYVYRDVFEMKKRVGL